MRTITMVATAALMLGLTACDQASTADTGSTPGAPATGAVTFAEKPPLSEDIEALPRLVGDSPAIVRINADLDRSDAAAVASAAQCAADAGDGPGGGWSRVITRPMTGPAYLTLRQHLDIYCGGAYPSTQQTAVTYDLATGAPVDWKALLPGLAMVQDAPMADMPADYVYSIRSPALEALYESKMLAEATDAEWRDQCSDRWKPLPAGDLGQGFRVWADAEHGGVAIDADYVHAVQACGGTVYLSAD